MYDVELLTEISLSVGHQALVSLPILITTGELVLNFWLSYMFWELKSYCIIIYFITCIPWI